MYLDNPLLVREISNKLPVSKRLEWTKHELSLTHKATLEDLSSCLNDMSRYIRRMEMTSSEKFSENNDGNGRKRIPYTL